MATNTQLDAATVKRRLPFAQLMDQEQIILRRSAGNLVALCPFHEEKGESFTIYDDHGHCYGCGWNGDIFDFWTARHGGVFVDALNALAAIAEVSPRPMPVRERVERSLEAAAGKALPELPRLRAMHDGEIKALAKLRGLSVGGIRAAAELKRVGWCKWPQYLDHNGAWAMARESSGCWVVTDDERRVAQFRRLDGLAFERKDGKQIKAWTKGSPTWPIGAGDLEHTACVLMVEGGADMLAAYHFLAMFYKLESVAVCSMLGASMKICAPALSAFHRKRVRIVMDDDEPKDERGIRTGCEAAARWTNQLVEAGAAVETFSLAGLLKKDGTKVKDLNDLALCDESVWLDPELKQAFVDFDF